MTIVDNGSTDGTVEYLKGIADHYDNITLDLQKKNLGVVKGRNHAYQISKNISPSTDFIMFIDNDQIVHVEWKDIYLKYMTMGFDIVGSEAWQMDKRRFVPTRRCVNLAEVFNYVGCGGMMIKHNVINNIGLFDEQFSPMYFEDPNFCWEAHEYGYKIAWAGNNVIDHHHKGSLLNNKTRKYFHNSLKKFQLKWGGKDMPIFKNESKLVMNNMVDGV